MPNCQNCTSKWSWSDAFKLSFSPFKGSKCAKCKQNQFISTKSRLLSSIISGVGVFSLILFTTLLDVSLPVYLSFGTLLILAVITTIPYSIKLSSEQEPLW